MTQSGQGEEPSARPAREGIVLPSDGGEPLLPGMTTGPVAPGGSAGGRQSGGGFPASAPPGGQTWGTPWGPDQQTPAPPPPGQDWQSPSDGQWNTPEQSPWGAQAPSGPGPGALPPEGAPTPPHGGPYEGNGIAPLPQPGAGYGGPQGAGDAYGPGGGGAGNGAAPMPQVGAGYDGGVGPASQGGGDAYGPGAGTQPGAGYGGHPGPNGAPGPHGAPDGYGAPLPPANGGAYGDPGRSGYGSPSGGGAPLPPAAPDGADGATQYLPPVAAGGPDEGATQYIPPVGPGALPPEMPAAHDSETTRFLGRTPQGAPGAGAGPLPPAGHPDAEATQYIAPVAGQPSGQPYGTPPPGEGNRQPPAEFDNLFRSDDGPAGSTQRLPRVGHGQPARGAHTPPAPPAPVGPAGGGRGGRRSGSRVPLIAAVGVGIAILGVGAGALLGSGGGDDDGGDNQTVSATAPAGEEASASPSVDPVRQQAVQLDKLLADSGDSRTAVINAVGDVKACRELGQAAKDLRDAAEQRNQLVTDLSGLSVDKLPGHQALTTALTKAWQASASADDHYAAWADQVAGAKGKYCKKGQARTTGQTQAGNRASGTATAEKAKAAKLWNTIARQYGLTERQPTQL
ncbi:hypothetical protein AB0D65_11725 [Streptomyces griseoloalbus]|uniref:Uncharacterized protein n=1 Tax=Streptomyces griseoloalbus TaxID=67303 RepID=A0ABV3E3C6_9ACTN